VLCELILRSKRTWRAALIGWAFGLGQFAVGLNWIATAFTYQSNMPAWLGWVAVLLLSIYLAIYPAIAAGFARHFSRGKPVALLLIFAGTWAITEYLRSVVFTGFPWNPAAAVLSPTPVITLGALIGTYGLSAVVVLLGGVIWLEYHKQYFPMAAIAAITVLLWLLPSSGVPPDPLAIVNVRIVQPNIGQEDKWRPGFDQEAARRLATLTGPPTGEARLILWPEAAITDPVEDGRAGAQGAAAFQRMRATSVLGPNDLLLTGGLAVDSRDGQHVDRATNSIYVLGPSGRILGRYDKAHLVPYGEYLPMRPLLSYIGLSRLAPGDLDFTPGPGPRTLNLGGYWGKVGFQLCYEMIFSGKVVDEQNRPGFIFNPSNDAWFGSWGPPQHLAQAQLRAAEEGIPVLRSTPTGISAVIDGRGKVVKSLGWHEAGVIDAVLPPAANQPTPFAKFGNLIPLLLSLLLVAGGIVLGRRRR
jgi:apolipoprotein N-acyltransferase